MITTWIFTRFGKSVHRVVWRGFWHCLECCTSGLVIMESIWILGPSFNSQKKTSFVQDSQISYWLQLESYFWGESSAICYKGWGSLFMENENVGNYQNCATQIILEILVTIISRFLLSGCSPLLPRTFSFSLALIWVRFGSFWGRNMTFTSRIPRVWVLLLWNGPVGLSFICKRLLIVESLDNIGCGTRFFLNTLSMHVCTLLKKVLV